MLPEKEPRVLLMVKASAGSDLYANTLPPSGLLGIVSNLRKNNIHVDVSDLCIDDSKISYEDYDIIGFSINSSNIAGSLELIKRIKISNHGIKIVTGGPSCISDPIYFTNNNYIDAVCETEGELAFLEYLKNRSYENGSSVPGFHIRTSGGIFKYGGKRQFIEDIDSLPFPAFDRVDLKKYSVPISKSSPVSCIMTSRGCPFNCIFCFHSMGYKWRSRSAENVVDEIEWQVNELGVKEICIQDDNYTFNPERAKRISEIIIERHIEVKLQLQNGIRADYVDYDLLKTMYDSGLWLVGLAPETGSSAVMNKIKKNMDLSSVKNAAAWCREIGLKTFSYFMIGFPFETRSDIEKTVKFTKELDTDFMQLARVVPFPGTELYNSVLTDELKNKFSYEQNLFSGIPEFRPADISEKELRNLIKKIHRGFYLSPRRIIELIKILPFMRLIKLFFFSIRTGNI